MTGALLEATVAEALKHRKNPRLAIGIQSPTPPDCVHVLNLPVAWCRSMLEMRERLSTAEPGNLIIVTPIEKLADDLRARIHKRSLLSIDAAEVLRQRYGARAVEGRVRADRIVCDALLRCAAPAVIPGGVLHEEAAWQVICPEIFDIPSARPDAPDLLRWMITTADSRLAAASPELRERLAAWLSRATGPIAETLLAVAAAGHARNAVSLGLALRVLLADLARPELAQALVRIERFTGNRPLQRETAETWAAAAEKVVQSGAAIEAIEASDRILHELGATQFAYLSRWSARGNEQKIDEFAADLAELPTNTARLESFLTGLRLRHWPSSDLPVLDRLEMSVRLLRWLHTSDPAVAEFEDAAAWYARQGSWVDWARTRIRGGYERGPLASALAKLSAAVKERRERLNTRFAAVLATWNNQGGHFRKLGGVESVMERYVAPLAVQEQSVLVIVLDGMSYAVCRELSAELAVRRWSALSPDSLEIAPAVTALPSVTEFSRFSLISGNLARGTQNAEEVAWSVHPALVAASGKSHPPILFHKNDLAAMADPDSPVLREIANTKRLVVGIVINAIDDSLSGPVQIAPDWNLEYLAVLRPLLAEAASAGRIVVLASDHGHILDFGTECRRHDSSDRYRSGKADTSDEFYIEGGRAIGPTGITTLGVEGVRYGPRPRNGYHGGITPQECLVPIVVLAYGDASVAGWQPVVEAPPEWWSGLQAAPAEASRVKRKPKQPSLFTEETDWVTGLLASDLFRQQLELPGNRIKAEQLAAALRTLDLNGGRLLRPAFASRMGLALVRVGPVVAAMQNVLNYDGYGILTIDEGAGMVVLDRPLLERQFSL
jgi:hypothetical protein